MKKTRTRNKLVFNHGINDYSKSIKQQNGKDIPAYRSWVTMLQRAYDPKYHAKHPTYKGVTICNKWHYFCNYKKWYDAQYPQKGEHLDKDLLIQNNKLYSPETCNFIPQDLNKIFNDHGHKTPGVNRTKSGKYKADIRLNGKKTYLGTFSTKKLAQEAYNTAKSTYVMNKLNRLKGTAYERRNPTRYRKLREAVIKRLEKEYGFCYNKGN